MSEFEFLWKQYKKAAAAAAQQGNLTKATRILKEAFRESEEFGELDHELIELAHSFAQQYLNLGRFSEAEGLYRLVLEVREKLLGQTHDDVVESLKRVAVVQIMAFRAEALGGKHAHGTMPWGDVLPATG
jgi:tetratricopeptide (TPR) repeat protein